MATSFAALASQFLNRPPESSVASSSQPMFFSFTTDGDGDDDDDDRRKNKSMNDSDDPHHMGEEDPYLQLDDERGRLIRSEHSDPPDSPQGGWLAHQGGLRSPSPASSETSTVDSPPPDLFAAPPPPPPVSLSLTQSLLPRDGTNRPLDVFSLPDPRYVPRGRRKFNDHIWTALWLAGVSLCLFFCVLLLFTTKSKKRKTPYTTLLHTVPLITILTFASAAAAYAHVLLLRIFVRPVMVVTSVFVPATLFISAVWAFVGSFMWEDGVEPTWGETTGLRLFSLIPLALSLITARRLLRLPRDIHTTSSTLTLTTRILIANPLLLALSPCILLLTLLASIPFVTLIFRLLLVGYFPPDGRWEWHVHGYAHWGIAGAIGVWLWTWGVARGVLRMTSASVVAAWYYADPTLPPPPPTSTHTIHAALFRSTGHSLGTICLSALILTGIRILTLLTLFLERLPLYLPAQLFFLVTSIRFAVGFLEGVTTALSKYALVYAGITGDAFMPSARRAKALTTQNSVRFSREPPLTVLTITPLTLTLPFALLTYLFVAHTLGAPNEALGAAVLAGGVTALVGLFCVGVVRDAMDTLFVCYCVDRDAGVKRRGEVFDAFEYLPRRDDDEGQRAERRGLFARDSGERERGRSEQEMSPSPTRFTREHQHQQQQPQKSPLPRSPPPQRRPPPPPPPPPQEELDLDPFLRDEDHDRDVEAQSQRVRTSMAASVSQSKRKDLSDSSDDDEGRGEASSSFFPGSGFF